MCCQPVSVLPSERAIKCNNPACSEGMTTLHSSLPIAIAIEFCLQFIWANNCFGIKQRAIKMPPTIARNSAKSKEEETRGKTAENSKKAKGSASKLMTLLLYASVCVGVHTCIMCVRRWEVGGGACHVWSCRCCHPSHSK